MPSKKRKYNARFPAGRIKKIMQTDEEVGKVAQAVPIIISRTLELFVESLLGKALQVTSARNAKTLSPSHVKQCILAEARFDFLRDLVKNIPDVSAAEEKELMSAESSPNSSRFPDSAPPRKIAREDSNSSSSCEVIRIPHPPASICAHTREQLKRVLSEPDKTAKPKLDTPSTSLKIVKLDTPSTSVKLDQNALLNILPIVTPTTSNSVEPGTSDTAIDLSKNSRPVRTANFYQETLITETVPHNSVIKLNPIYSNQQPSTSYSNLNVIEPVRKVEIASKPPFERHNSLPRTPVTPISPIINIDFSKNIARPEIKVLDAAAAVANVTKLEAKSKLSRQNSKSKIETKKDRPPSISQPVDSWSTVDIDSLNSGNLQIDEDYDT